MESLAPPDRRKGKGSVCAETSHKNTGGGTSFVFAFGVEDDSGSGQGLMRHLQREYDRLNPEQKEAVRSSSNTVVLAGPGSGKTETLVIKIAHLLSSEIRAPRGLACLTYNNDTVKEFRNRLAGFGIHPERRVFLGTVHSFCLNCILRPFGTLVS